MNIIELLKTPEGKTLEFKRDLSSHRGIVHTMIAFANTAGGILVIGVEDKSHHIVGIADPLLIEEKVTNLIHDSIEPLILPDIEIFSHKKAQIIAIHIYPSSIRPHFLKSKGLENGTYVRVGSSNRLADAALIQELKRFAANQSYDEQPMTTLNSDSIDFKVASDFFDPIRTLNSQHLKTLRILVEHQGKTVPTIAGILLFGKKREEYFPDAWIQAGRFLGGDKSNIQDSLEIHSYPIAAIEEAFGFVKKHATIAFEIDAAKRTEHWNIPFKAVREAIINAVTHADYSQQGAPIRLSIFHDRLEIENPGLLPFGLTIEEISQGVSKLRNRVIGRIFNELKLVERWGSGIQRIISACEENGLEKPKFEEIGTHFRVTIYIQQKERLLLDTQDQSILDLLKTKKAKNGLSTHDIAENIKLSGRATRARLGSLLERDLIAQIGSGPNDPTRRFLLKKESIFITLDEHIKYKELLHRYGYDEDNFLLLFTKKTNLTKTNRNLNSEISIIIKNKETDKKHTYYYESDWLNNFENDIEKGLFDVKHEATRFKSMEIALKEIAPYVQNGTHLQKGKPFTKMGNMRSREIWANWLLCATINEIDKSKKLRFSSDPTGGDGIIEDSVTNQTWLTEHIFLPKQDTIDNVNIENFILKAIAKKRAKGGAAYASGKILIVFLDVIGEWFPNKVAKKLPNPLLFSQVWVIGLKTVKDGAYTYGVTLLDIHHGDAPIYLVHITNNFSSWTVEICQ